jgi:hypothetical protein
VFLEIGPHPVLATYTKEIIGSFVNFPGVVCTKFPVLPRAFAKYPKTNQKPKNKNKTKNKKTKKTK